jgi:hypothetical protein
MCPFVQNPEGFSPEMLELLDRAFSAAWQELQQGQAPSVSGVDEQATRAAVAKSILDLAATGVREPARLRRHALHAAEQAIPRTRTIVHLPE